MRSVAIGLLAVLLCMSAGVALGATIEVTPDSIAEALAAARPGDTLILADGTYPGGLRIDVSGAPDAPIVIKAAGSGAVFEGGKRDGFVVGASYVVVEGIRFQHAGRGGIGLLSEPDRPITNVTVRKCVLADNGVWGLITSHVNRLLIEDNEAFGSKEQHGIYVSNSGDDPVVRNNRIHDNNSAAST